MPPTIGSTVDIRRSINVSPRRSCMRSHSIEVVQRKVFTTPLLTEANKRRNCRKFTKKKSRCQRGGVRGAANQNATTERRNLQIKRCSKVEAAALRKNHVVGRYGSIRSPIRSSPSHTNQSAGASSLVMARQAVTRASSKSQQNANSGVVAD